MSLNANLYLQVLVLVTSVAATIGRRLAVDTPQPVPTQKFELRRKVGFFYFGLLASLLSAFFTLQTTGVALGDLSSPLAIMRAAQRVTYERYSEGLDFPILYNVSNALLLSYATALAAHFAVVKRVDWRMSLPLVIFTASNMLITARAPILFMLLLMIFSALYAAKLTSAGGNFIPLLHRNVVKTSISIALFVGGIFVLFQILRFGEDSTRSVADVWTYLRRWPWGSLPGFSIWYDGPANTTIDTVPGYYTFMGIYDNLGIARRQQGIFADYNLLTRRESANVYTAFRGLYHDFGPVGSGVFLVFVGFFGGIVAKGKLSGPYVSLSIYVAVMTFSAFAFVVSFWAYTANLAALILLPFVLKYFTTPPKSVHHRHKEATRWTNH